ncbi:MAG: FAD-dependent oxidoreductase [Erysipelotrichia bacterium]|nr:FAD-dependent oxidoreductase [Erysipelotrichia bacterium]
MERDLVIIGGGSAGMAAAIGAYDDGVKDIIIIEKGRQLGGILNQCIHNGFGLEEFKEQLTGPEFMTRLIVEIQKRKIDVRYQSNVLNLTKDKVVTFSNSIDGIVKIKAKAVILATGCYERSAGAIQIPGERPSGIITAGTAQLYLNEMGALVGKRIFILGSGDIGLIMARRLTLEGAKVLGVSEIMPYSNGLNHNIVQCLHDFDIPLFLSHTVTKTIGKSRLEKIEISQVDDNFNPITGTEKVFEIDTLLLSIGLIPSNDLLKKLGLPVSKARGAIVDEHYMSDIPGIFSTGNVLHVHDLADFVTAESRSCGKGAAAYIFDKWDLNAPCFNVSPGKNILYVVPHRVRLANLEDHLTVKFRVNKPLKDQVLIFTFNGQIIKKIIKPIIIPSEMQKVRLPKELFATQEGELIVSAEDRT